jgi:hypothetical protein
VVRLYYREQAQNEKNRIELSVKFGKDNIINVLQHLQQHNKKLQNCIEQIKLIFEPENNLISELENNLIFLRPYLFITSNYFVSNESNNSSELFSLSFSLKSNNKEESPSHLIVDD